MRTDRLVHLELHTADPAAARAFLAGMCGWRSARVGTSAGVYEALDLGSAVSGGLVGCPAPRTLWLPYAEVREIEGATERALELGARLMLEPREGPAGWRSVIHSAAAGELALWQPKR